ncbi:MAG: mechanosensitive ion channel family protein [Actinomycetota bacterium]
MNRVNVIQRKNRYRFRLLQAGCIAGIILSLSYFLLLTPAAAQVDLKASTAPVILDGRQIFRVSRSGQFTAKERADLINSQLREAVSSPELLRVRIEKRNQLPTILLNDRYLLTVTESDEAPGTTPQEQAETWAMLIQQVVNQSQEERSGQYLWDALIEATGIALGAVALHFVLGWFWHDTIRRVLQKVLPVPNPSPSFDLILDLTLLSARVGLWVATVLYITNLFPLTRRWSYEIIGSLSTTFTAPIITLGNKAYSVTGLLMFVAVWWGLLMVAGTTTNVLRSRILQVAGINRAAQEIVAVFTKYSLITLGTVVLLQIWGLDLSSLTILASALGVGIGFGFQDIAKNFGSGLVLILERPIQIGDFIEVGEYKGIVERIGSRSTLIRTLDQVSIIVPNSRFLEKELINWNHGNPVSGVRLSVGVAYDSNVEAVREVLLAAASDHPDVLSVPEPQVLLKGFGDNSLNFELRVWTNQPSKQFIIRSDLYYHIERDLRRRKIIIPFPQRDLHLRTGHLPIQVSPQLEALLFQLLQTQKVQSNQESDLSGNGSKDPSVARESEGDESGKGKGSRM